LTLWHSRKLAWSVLLLAFVLIVAACGGDDDTGDEATTTAAEAGATTGAPSDTTAPPTDGTTAAPVYDYCADAGEGNLIWAHEQEPPDLHLDDPENNLSATSWIRQAMWEGLYGVTASTEFFPELLAEEAVIAENGDGTVTGSFKLREGLVWSDGDDLTADDVKYTFDMIMASDGTDEEGNPNYIYLLGDRTGYDTITDFTVVSPTEFTITWSAFFSGYPALFSEIHPSHVFPADPAEAAAAENEALREWSVGGTVIPSSGPMVFESWERGVQMNMVRNDVYHGSNSPDVQNKGVAYVDGVQINFVTDTDAQINALLAGEAQIVMTQPQLQFEQLAESEDFTVAASAGPVYEHWGFNLFNAHLSDVAVREAMALAMDKGEVMEGLYAPLFGDLLPANGLGNTYWMSNQSPYEDHQGDAGYGVGDVDGAKAKLEGAGYVMGDDGIYEHPERGRLSLRVGTTGGNRLREIQQQLLQAKFAEAGIEIVIDNVEGGAYFSEQPFSEGSIECANSGGTAGNCDIWDIAQFAWVGGPWPGSNSAAFRTGSGNNAYGYANPEFDAKADECDATIDDDARAACYNEADKYVTTTEIDPNGLVVIPITQKPSFYGYTSQLSQAAVAPDANSAGPLVNVVDYQFAS
jgi:peptide/nickel transport system substrate-binding protein